MKLSWLLAAGLFAANAPGAELGDVKTVYMLPMANGLDQFLAIRLTRGALLQVVTDPQKADAVFTDRIGAGFEQTLDGLYLDKTKDKDDKDKMGGDTPKPATSLSRARGAVFLVDRKTRNVVWSDYARPKSSQPDEMNHLADRIVSKLEKDRKGK
jgi:hypothetical protein